MQFFLCFVILDWMSLGFRLLIWTKQEIWRRHFGLVDIVTGILLTKSLINLSKNNN